MRSVTFMGAVHGRDGNYGILFPDFLGCVSGGESVADAVESGREALQFHIEGMEEDNEVIPAPGTHTIESVAADFFVEDDPDPDNWVGLVPIEVKVAEASDQVATMTLHVKADLVAQIADLARVTARQIDSSRFIEDAVQREIERFRKSA